MKTRPRLKVKADAEVRTGNILLAKPFWQEEVYKRSVILLIDIRPEGSTGIILNKMSNLSVHDALPELAHGAPLYYGGPINKKTISYVHNNPGVPDSYYLGNGLFWGGNYDNLLEMDQLHKLNLDEFRFCAGFVQWRPGELESELHDNKWWINEISSKELFLSSSEDLWGDMLVEGRHVYGLFNPHPDPSLN